MTDRPATEPRTEAGKRLDQAWPGSHIDRLDWRDRILAIEAEARVQAFTVAGREALAEAAQGAAPAVAECINCGYPGQAAQGAAPHSERAPTLLMKMDRTGPDDVTLAEVKTFLVRLSEDAAPRAEGLDGSHAFPNCEVCGAAVDDPEATEPCARPSDEVKP